jgi:hypothetical protein
LVGFNTPPKQSRFEMKNYKLCRSTTGYLWNCIVYTGKDTTYGKRHPGEQNLLRIVLELVHDLPDKGYCLYLDNWYTNPKLDDNLCSRKTDVAGTITANKKEFPDFMKRARLQGRNSGSIPQETSDHYKEKKEMSHSTTYHDDSMEDVTASKGVICHYKAVPFFRNSNLQLSPLYMRPSINHFRHISNHILQTAGQHMRIATVTPVYHSVMQYSCSLCCSTV